MAACDTAPMAHVCLLPGAQFPPQRPAPAQGDAGAAASNAPNGAESVACACTLNPKP